jgi:PAS domain S-box-containing protein
MRARYFPGERDRIDRLGAEALARGERFLEVEYRYLWPDGSIRWLLLRAEGQFDASGKLYRAVGVIMDITDRRQAETNLIESQKRLELAQIISGIGVWDWYPRTSEIVWSPAMYELLGIDKSTQPSQLYQAWSDGLLEDDHEAASAAPRLAADEGKAFSIEFRVQLRGGAVRWVRSSGSPVIEGDPPYRVIGVSIDVTAEKEREQELKAIAQDLKVAVDLSERQKARIFELSTDLLGLVGPDGNLESFNEVWVRKLGLSAAEIARTPFVDLLTPDGRASAQAALVSREASPPRQFETRMQTRRQHDLVVIWTVMSYEKLTYLLGRDVTREREQEEPLLQTQKMEAVGQLTGGISHDFNNLLHAVRASFDLILRRPGDGEKVRRFAEAGREAAERGSKLTAQLLAFSRSQTPGLDCRPRGPGAYEYA